MNFTFCLPLRLTVVLFGSLLFGFQAMANTTPLTHSHLQPYENPIIYKLKQNGFKGARAFIYSPLNVRLGNEVFKYKLRPALFIFDEADWSDENIIQQLEQTALIYSQCGILMDQALIIRSKHPFGNVEFNGPHTNIHSPQTKKEDLQEDIVASLIPEELKNEFRPFVFFMGKIVKGPENPGGMVAFAYPPYYLTDSTRKAQNTIWMASNTVYWDGTARDYRPDMLNGLFLAHELGHVIGNHAHEVDLPDHLMSPGPECTRIVPESCQAFIKGGFLF